MAGGAHRFLSDPLLRNPVFLFCLFLYGAYRAALKLQPGFVPAAVQHYLADLLCLPILLTVAVLIQRYIVLRNREYLLSHWQVIFAWAYFSVLFEAVFPLFLERYTADIADVAAYGVGAAIYWFFSNRNTLPA